jgi:hypothetical protein
VSTPTGRATNAFPVKAEIMPAFCHEQTNNEYFDDAQSTL